MKKYEFTGVTKSWLHGKTLHQIRALRDFGEVHAGDIGGFIEKEDNLSHDGLAWVGRNAVAYSDTRVYGDALLAGWSKASGETRIYGNAVIAGQSHVKGDAWICKDAYIRYNTDYISLRGLWESGKHVTAFLNNDNEIMIVCDDYSGDLKGFMLQQLEQSGGVGYFKETHMMERMIELHFKKK